jgi:hypothetical protein
MCVLDQDWPAVKSPRPERSIRLALPPGDAGPGVAEITTETKKSIVFGYYVTPIPGDFGTAFQVQKVITKGGEVYNVNLNGRKSTCECKGFLRWGRCKHVAGLQALRDEGKL